VVPTTLHGTCITSHAPELAMIAESWPDLPPVVKAGILAMIEAAKGVQQQNGPSA